MPLNEQFEFVHFDNIKHLKIFVNSITHCVVHYHDAWELGLVLHGKARVRTSESIFTCVPDDILLFEPFAFHEITAEQQDPTTFVFIQISPHFCHEYFKDFHNAHFLAQHIGSDYSGVGKKKLIHQMFHICYSFFTKEPYYLIRCVGMICSVAETLLKEIPNILYTQFERARNLQRKQRIQRITDYIEQHYFEANILMDIAQREGLSVPYLSTFFRKNLGMPFRDYLQILRFDKALNLFESNKSLIEICAEVGFSSIRYLNDICMREFGMVAKDLRRINCRQKSRTTPLPHDTLQNTVIVYDQASAERLIRSLLAKYANTDDELQP